jgi:hypothetical protein
VGFNTAALPLRVNTPECNFYVRTGHCKYGRDCKFNHPEGVQQMPHGVQQVPYNAAVRSCTLRTTVGRGVWGVRHGGTVLLQRGVHG